MSPNADKIFNAGEMFHPETEEAAGKMSVIQKVEKKVHVKVKPVTFWS